MHSVFAFFLLLMLLWEFGLLEASGLSAALPGLMGPGAWF